MPISPQAVAVLIIVILKKYRWRPEQYKQSRYAACMLGYYLRVLLLRRHNMAPQLPLLLFSYNVRTLVILAYYVHGHGRDGCPQTPQGRVQTSDATTFKAPGVHKPRWIVILHEAAGEFDVQCQMLIKSKLGDVVFFLHCEVIPLLVYTLILLAYSTYGNNNPAGMFLTDILFHRTDLHLTHHQTTAW
jgi:hypothetical protein